MYFEIIFELRLLNYFTECLLYRITISVKGESQKTKEKYNATTIIILFFDAKPILNDQYAMEIRSRFIL